MLIVIIALILVKTVFSTSIPWLEQMSRHETLTSGCERLESPQKFNISNLDHILVDHKHRFLYCYVPKVACTNWKRVLMVLTGKSNLTNVASISASLVHSDGALVKLSEIEYNLAEFALTNYTMFLMVRHPFERLLSAFRNKLEDNLPSAKYFQSIFGRHIIKTYRDHPKSEEIKKGENVTFREFVKFLIAEGVNNENANEHWRSVYSLCHPCSLNYTFVGKYESFADDAEIILGMINAPKLMFPQTRSGKTGERLRMYYQQLTLEDIENLYRLYENDFKLFGYTLDNILGYDIG